MNSRLLGAGLILAIAAGPGAPAFAGGSDIVGGIIGGMIGGAIVNEANRSRPPRTVVRTVPAQPSVSSYQREQNREVQTALNYFGYPVGTPDGVIGARSRSAISQYQALLGYPASGALSEVERQILVTAYQRAMIGGPQIQQAMAGPQGIRGLLLQQRDQMMGGGASGSYAANSYGGLPPEVAKAVDEIARNSGVEGQQLISRAGFIQLADMNSDGRTDYLIDTSVTGSGFWCNGPACTVEVFASTPSGYQRNDFQLAGATPAAFSCQQGQCAIVAPGAAPVPVTTPAPVPAAPALPPAVMAAQPAVPAMPGFATQVAQPAPAVPAMPAFGAAMVPPAPTWAGYCAKIAAATGSNGGLQTVAAMSDPAQALGEQFCAAGQAVTAEGERLVAQIQGFTAEQVAQQCSDFGALLSDQVAALPQTPRDDEIAAVQGFLKSTGMSAAQLAGTAKVCLSSGYARDAMPVALGSALVLAGTGDLAYAELVGHHLVAGLGTDKRPDLALDWFDMAQGAQVPLPVAGGADRGALIHKAALVLNGRAEAPATASQPVPGVPGFAAAAGALIPAVGVAAPIQPAPAQP